MKKLLCLIVGALGVVSCVKNAQKVQYVEAKPDAAYYSDWDSAIRYDVDMQNMYANSPTKIEKPLDLYMTTALALKYNYTGRMVRYHQLQRCQSGFEGSVEYFGYFHSVFYECRPKA